MSPGAPGGQPDPEQLKAMLKQGIAQIRKMAQDAGIPFEELLADATEMKKPPSPLQAQPPQRGMP